MVENNNCKPKLHYHLFEENCKRAEEKLEFRVHISISISIFSIHVCRFFVQKSSFSIISWILCLSNNSLFIYATWSHFSLASVQNRNERKKLRKKCVQSCCDDRTCFTNRHNTNNNDAPVSNLSFALECTIHFHNLRFLFHSLSHTHTQHLFWHLFNTTPAASSLFAFMRNSFPHIYIDIEIHLLDFIIAFVYTIYIDSIYRPKLKHVW